MSLISTCSIRDTDRAVWCVRRCLLRLNLKDAVNRPEQASISSVVLPEEAVNKLVSAASGTSLLSIVQPGLGEFRFEFARGAPEQWLAFSESERVTSDNVHESDYEKHMPRDTD